MRSIRHTLRGPSLLPKTLRNRAVPFRTRFATILRSEVRISLEVKADARVGLFSGVLYIISVKDSEGDILGSAHASTTYGM
jgi:hypothetical protein